MSGDDMVSSRDGTDDVLFVATDPTEFDGYQLAEVHLTRSGKAEPAPWPQATRFRNLAQWYDRKHWERDAATNVAKATSAAQQPYRFAGLTPLTWILLALLSAIIAVGVSNIPAP